MEIALSPIPIWHTCRRLWDPVVSVMPTARVCSVKSFQTGHGLEPVSYLSPVALLPLSLSGYDRKIESPLERILNAEFTGDRFDRFIVLNGGHGAWKQPNQYIFFGLYADILAGVITLDGFNEHYMINSHRRFELPANLYFDAIQRQDPRVITAPFTMAALKLDADLYRFASRHAIFQVSNLAYFMVDVVRRTLRRYASRTPKLSIPAEDDWVKASYAQMFAFHDEMTPEESKIWSLRQYEKYIRLIHAGAEALRIKSLFLIQPIPGWGKPAHRAGKDIRSGH